jgi:putative ABC transport system substrate-binding protein
VNRKVFLKLALAGASALALNFGVAMAEPVKIAVANFGDHPQLNAVVDGFKAELAAAGYKEGEGAAYTVDHVNFDATLVPQMLSKIEAQKPAMILVITTPVAQMAKNTLGKSGIPLVFAAVTDPVAAGLVPSWDAGDENMSGASDLQDVAATLTFARKLLPNAKNLGIPYNPGEANDVALIDIMKTEAPKQGFAVVEVGVDNVNDIPQRISSLAGKADVIYVPGSNLIQPAIASVASAAMAAKIPVVNTDGGPVSQGIVTSSFAMSYEKVGHNAGKIAARILKGEKASAIAPSKPAYEDHAPLISKKAAAAIGMEIPESLKDCGCIVE